MLVERNSNIHKIHILEFVGKVKTYTVYVRWQMKIYFAMSRHRTDDIGILIYWYFTGINGRCVRGGILLPFQLPIVSLNVLFALQ